MLFVRLAAAATVATAISFCATAPASATGYGDTAPVQKLAIDVKARIPAHCGFQGAANGPQGAQDLTVAHDLVLPFKLDCNTPFVIGVKSRHGALTSNMTPDGSGYAFSKAYTVGLDVGTDGSPLRPRPCDAQALTPTGDPGQVCTFYGAKAGQGLSSGALISIDRPSALELHWDGQGHGPRNVAGRYSDTITITVAARS